jgi:hypothetical protein
MAKKSKTRRAQVSGSAAAETAPAAKGVARAQSKATPKPDKKGAARLSKKVVAQVSKKDSEQPAKIRKAADGKKRVSLTVNLPVGRARKLAGDLYQSAGLAFWTAAIESAPEPARAELISLQDAVCDAADLFKEARAANPKHLALYMVACYDRDDLAVTPPRFITAASGQAALDIWRAAFKGVYGRRTPRAVEVPPLASAAALHE